jgi:hypothetical protein
MTEPTYFLRWTDASGAPHATTEPMPRGQLKNAVMDLWLQGCTGFRAWEERGVHVDARPEVVVIGDVLE